MQPVPRVRSRAGGDARRESGGARAHYGRGTRAPRGKLVGPALPFLAHRTLRSAGGQMPPGTARFAPVLRPRAQWFVNNDLAQAPGAAGAARGAASYSTEPFSPAAILRRVHAHVAAGTA